MENCKWWFITNKKETLRERFGMWLRDLADRVDGRDSIAVEMVCSPDIVSRDTKLRCLRKGLELSAALFNEEFQAESLDAYMVGKSRLWDWVKN